MANEQRGEGGRTDGGRTAADAGASADVAVRPHDDPTRFRRYVDEAPVAVFVADAEGRYVEWNRAALDLLGYTDDELAQLSIPQLTAPEDLEAGIAHFRRLVEHGTSEGEVRLLRRDGSRVWTLVRAVRLTPQRFVAYCQDVTARRAAESALLRSEERYRTLFETTFDWIWEVDSSGRYMYSSPKVVEVLGHRPEEVIGRTPFDFMPPDEARRVGAIFERIVASGRPFHGLENIGRHKDGRLIVLESSGVPLLDEQGRVSGYRGVDRDITERRRAERRIAIQAAVSRALADSDTLPEAVPHVLATIGHAENWDFAAAWSVEGSDPRLRCIGSWVRDPEAAAAWVELTRTTRLALGEDLPGQVWARGETLHRVCDPAARHERCQASMAAAGLGVPILRDGRVVGVLEFAGAATTAPDANLLQLFTALGIQLGQFVARRQAQQQLRRFVELGPATLYAVRIHGERPRLAWISPNVTRMTGFEPEDVHEEWWLERVHPDDRARVSGPLAPSDGVEQRILEYRFQRKDGSWIWIRDERRLVRDSDGQPFELVGVCTDVTARVVLEEQLQHAQKMEAIGRVAGGVAHDFNNLLMVVGGCIEALLPRFPAPDPDRVLATSIQQACERATGLTRQLLAFSRRQVLSPRRVALGAIVEGIEPLLRPLLGTQCRLVLEQGAGIPDVMVDPGQIEQAVANLAANARDAMPKGGTVSISTACVELDAAAVGAHTDRRVGRYATLAVADTGTGMPPEVVARAFEPFFTTKEPGKGTGLGLPSVYGVVQQSGGFVTIDSVVGAGTTIVLHFPAIA